MSFLIDTNVLSELTRPTPEANVLAWLDSVDEDRTYVSAVTLAEIRRGVMLKEPGRRRDELASWLSHDLHERFSGRIVPIDEEVAARWGDLMADSKRRGFPMNIMDGFIAASAVARACTLVTRNVRDFQPLGLDILNPWASHG